MRRRDLITGITGAILPWALHAQQKADRRRVAFLSSASSGVTGPALPAFQEGLRALGYRDTDITIEIRYAEGKMERLPDLASELVRLNPEVIVAPVPAAVMALRQVTSTIPIVMANIADPVGAGFVASLAHPGGNITGLANLAQETAGKRLQMLTMLVPGAKRIAILLDPINRGNILQLRAAREVAPALNLEALAVEARATAEIGDAFAVMARERADALFVADDPVFLDIRAQILSLAARQNLPAIYQSRRWVMDGGLLSYGTDLEGLFRQVATYVDKILKGAKPADLPVEQPTKFELVINLKTAKALGLTVPPSILARADEVIE